MDASWLCGKMQEYTVTGPWSTNTFMDFGKRGIKGTPIDIFGADTDI